MVHAPLLIGAAERESFMYAADGRRVCPKSGVRTRVCLLLPAADGSLLQ